MNERHCCVIDAGNRYKTVVLVADGEVQYYTMKDGELLIDTKPPKMRMDAGSDGFLSPVWDASAKGWVESATAEEIAAWETDHPAPEVVDVVSQLDMIEAQVVYTAMMTDTLLEV